MELEPIEVNVGDIVVIDGDNHILWFGMVMEVVDMDGEDMLRLIYFENFAGSKTKYYVMDDVDQVLMQQSYVIAKNVHFEARKTRLI